MLFLSIFKKEATNIPHYIQKESTKSYTKDVVNLKISLLEQKIDSAKELNDSTKEWVNSQKDTLGTWFTIISTFMALISLFFGCNNFFKIIYKS